MMTSISSPEVLAECARMHARVRLLAFARELMPMSFLAPDHIRHIAQALEDVESGRCRRLMIFCPPRHGKSLLTSELFPSWYMGRHPDRYVIHATYGQELSDVFGRSIRNKIASPEFEGIFPDCRLAQDSKAASSFSIAKHGGSYLGVGIGGAATGRGAHLLLVDDPIKGREEADSDTYRARLQAWYREVAYTRLMPGGAIVIIQTRWHHDDLSGWLLRDHQSEGWRVISLPAIAIEGDPLNRSAGAPLWPQMYDAAALSATKHQLGSRAWASLYQQDPMPDDGSVFRLDWFKPWVIRPDLTRRRIHSWDTGIKPDEIHDPSVGQYWVSDDKGYYLLDQFKKAMAYPDLRRAVVSMYERDIPDAVLIEDKGSGQSLLQDLRASTNLPVIAMPAKENKVFRAQAITPTCEAGRVFVPSSAPWLMDFQTEVAQFPMSNHDDQVDAMVHALTYLRNQEQMVYDDNQSDDWDRVPKVGRIS